MRAPLFLLLAGLLLATAGCGFHLRGSTRVPDDMRQLILQSNDPYGPMTRTLQHQLRLNGVRLVADHTRTDVPTLRILNAAFSQKTVSIFQDGKTAEYQQVLDVQAQVLIPGSGLWPLQATVYRSFFDNPLAALAKDSESGILLQEMREEAANQLIRKLPMVQHRDAASAPATAVTNAVTSAAATAP